MFDTSGQCQKKVATLLDKKWTGVIYLMLIVGFVSACDTSSPAPSGGVLSVELQQGTAWLGGSTRGAQLNLGQSLVLNWNQTLWAGEEASATLLVGESDQLILRPSSGFRLVSPVPPDERPVLRLLEGGLSYRARGTRYALGVHLEIASELRIQVTDLIVFATEADTELEMRIEDNVVTVDVLMGELDARGNGVSATLLADWRAIVRPGEPMEVIPPRPPDTPTPTVTSTLTPRPTRRPTATDTPSPEFMATSTLTPTLTPTPTFTPTATSRPRPVATRTPTSPPTPSPVPTQPPPPPPTQPPPPTATPVPPPTATSPPPPTATPLPPPTETVRPTPGGGF